MSGLKLTVVNHSLSMVIEKVVNEREESPYIGHRFTTVTTAQDPSEFRIGSNKRIKL